MFTSGKRYGWQRQGLCLVLIMVAAACGSDGESASTPDGASSSPDTTADGGGAGSGDTTPGTTSGETTTGETTPVDDPSDSQALCDASSAKTLTFDTGSPTTALDPTQFIGAATTGGIQGTAVFDTLLRYDPEAGEYVPHVAESFEQTDELAWTVVLRDGVKFGNGRLLTADDLASEHSRMQEAFVSSGTLAGLIDRIEVVDERTAIYHLSEPWGEFPYYLAEEGGMLVDTTVAAERGDEEFNINPLGAGVGPYEFGRFAPGEELVLKARQDYWDGEVCIGEIRFIATGSADTALDAMLTGEVDVAFMTDSQVADRASTAGLNVTRVVSGAGDVLLLNQGAHGVHGPTDDLLVRQAIVAALDADLLNDRVYGGKALATKALTWSDQAIHPDVAAPTYDPDLAQQLVTSAKAAGWDGRVNLLCTNTPAATERSITVEGLLEAVGMDVEVENVDSPTLYQRIAAEGDYQIGCWGGNIPDPSPWATVLAQYASDAPTNRVGLQSADMDQALIELRQSSNVDERRSAMADVQTAWNDSAPAAVLTAQTWFIVSRPQVSGIAMTRDGIPMLDKAYFTG